MIKARNQEDHELSLSTHTHRSKALKIMVADHDRDLVDLLSFWLKRQGYDVVRALILTGSACEEDEVRGLEMGADDYLRKPLSLRRLLARITAVMRRASHAHPDADSSVITVGPFTLDVMRHEVLRDERKVKVTPTESRLLHY